MTSFSTPLNQLSNDQPEQNSADTMVNDILNEMEINNTNVNNDTLNYAMDESQIPPNKMDVNFLNSNSNNNDNIKNKVPENVEENNKEVSNNTFISKFNLSNDMENKLKYLFSQLKNTFIVCIIVTIVSLPQFNRFIFNYFNSMLLESGEINMKGVILKGIIGTIMFIILSFLV